MRREDLLRGLENGSLLPRLEPVYGKDAPGAAARLRELTDQVVWQIREYQKHGFAVLGIVGMDRSPCCGVNTTSDQDRELPGRGVFIASLRAALESAGLTVPVIGIKPSAPEALDRVRSLLGE